jgi:hypothetical protein
MSKTPLTKLLACAGTIVSALFGHTEGSEGHNRLLAYVDVNKPYRKRKLKTDMFHRLMRSARKYKRPTVQQLYKSRLSRKKWVARNKPSLAKRRMFVDKVKQRLHIKSALSIIANRK